MQNIPELLEELRRNDMTLWLEGDQLRYKAPSGTVSSDILRELRRLKTEIIAFLRTSALPLAFAQEALAKSYQALDDAVQQHLTVAKRVFGPLDVRALRESFSALLARHAILRARYLMSGSYPAGVLIDGAFELSIPLIDLTAAAGADRETKAHDAIANARAERFDLEHGPLLRVLIVRLGSDEHVLAVVIHHSIADAWSLKVLVQDLGELYSALVEARVPHLPALPLQFTDHAAWLRTWLRSESAHEHLSYWRDRLGHVQRPFWLPSEPSGVERTPGHGWIGLELDSRMVSSLKELARRERATVPTVLLAAYAVALSRWSCCEDVLITVLHFGRHRPELWNLIGCFIQSWVLRVDLRGAPPAVDVLRQVRDCSYEAEQHAQVPFALLKRELQERSDEKPLLHITFNYLPAAPARESRWSPQLTLLDFGRQGFQPTALDENRGEKLVLSFSELEDSIQGMVRYDPRRFAARTIDLFCEDFRSILREATTSDRCQS